MLTQEEQVTRTYFPGTPLEKKELIRLLQELRKKGWQIPMEEVDVGAALPSLDLHLKRVPSRAGEKGPPRI